MISSLIDTIRIIPAIDHQQWLAAQEGLYNAGTINPITKACAGRFRRFTIPGAHGSTATVWSKKNATELIIEASLPRFLTGQNVFGSEDLQATAYLLVRKVCNHLKIDPTAVERKAVREGRIRLARVDLTTHLKLKSDTQVEHFLKAMKLQLAFGHHNFSAYGNETLYINQHSDTKTLKFYNKGRQLKKMPLDQSLRHRDHIEASAEGLLRTELVLRRRYLGRVGIREVLDWDPMAARELLRTFVGDLQLRNVRLTEFEPQAALHNQANILLAAHMSGVDLETVLRSARSLSAHARAIVEATGINIYVPFVAQAASAKVDLESFASVLEFGTNAEASALGITDALVPKTKLRNNAAEPIAITVAKSTLKPSTVVGVKNRQLPLGPNRSAVGYCPPGWDPIRLANSRNL